MTFQQWQALVGRKKSLNTFCISDLNESRDVFRGQQTAPTRGLTYPYCYWLTGVVELLLLECCRPLPFWRVPGPAAVWCPGYKSRPAVVQRQQGSSGACDSYRQSLPHVPGLFVKVLLQVVCSGGGLGSDWGSGCGGRRCGRLTGQQYLTVPTVLTLVSVLARFVALYAHWLIDGRSKRLLKKNMMGLEQRNKQQAKQHKRLTY